MTKEDWDNVDKPSRMIFHNFLLKVGGQNITHTKGNIAYDLKCENFMGEKIGFEIKDRQIASTLYGDHIVETLKERSLEKRMLQQEFKRVIVCSFFTDNIMVLSDLNDSERTISNKWCNETTMVKGASNKKVLKEIIHLPQRIKYRYEKIDDDYKFTRI